MRKLTLLLFPVVALLGANRYARLGDFDGKVEIQLSAPDPWQPAVRNLPLTQGAWVRTGAGSRVELELDDGNGWRQASDSLAELSDYTRLSTGQRITLISLERGLGYYTGAAERSDAIVLAVPGAEITITQGSRVRLEARDSFSAISVIEGNVRFSSPAAEFPVREGQTVRLDSATPSRFNLTGEITPFSTDRWNEARDQVLSNTTSAAHLNDLRYGIADLDRSGTWIETASYGTVWKPKVETGWTPFHEGRWQWYEGIGYTWIGSEPWAWLPYHYGRWTQDETNGWFWVPGRATTFKPGDVYWLRGASVAGWGPLAPFEQWQPNVVPRLFLYANTTYAKFIPDAREIDPAGFARPKDPLSNAALVEALPSPALAASRLDAQRPVLRVGSTRIVPQVPNGYDPEIGPTPPPPPVSDDRTVSAAPPPPPPPVDPNGGPAVYPVPVPVYSPPIVIFEPSGGRGGYYGGSRRSQDPAPQPAAQKPQPPARKTEDATHPAQRKDPPLIGPRPPKTDTAPPIRHTEDVRRQPAPKVEPPKPAEPASKQLKSAREERDLDLYRAAAAEADFKKRIALISLWKRELPSSIYNYERDLYLLQAYHQLRQGDQVVRTAREMLAMRPDDLTAHYWIAYYAIGNPDKHLTTEGERAGHTLLAAKKPDTADPAEWAKTKKELDTIAHNALGWAAWQQNRFDVAMQEFAKK